MTANEVIALLERLGIEVEVIEASPDGCPDCA